MYSSNPALTVYDRVSEHVVWTVFSYVSIDGRRNRWTVLEIHPTEIGFVLRCASIDFDLNL